MSSAELAAQSDMILFDDDPFTEYLTRTSQRIDNIRIEHFEHALHALSDAQASTPSHQHYLDQDTMSEIADIEQSIVMREHTKLLFIIYAIAPCLVQPVSRLQKTANDILADFAYDRERTSTHKLYASLFAYFYDSDHDSRTDSDNGNGDNSLFSCTLIIHSKLALFAVLAVHACIAISVIFSSLDQWWKYAVFALAALNAIFVAMDIVEFYEWNCFAQTMHAYMHNASEFYAFMDRSFKILNNVTAVTSGYALHHQYLASHNIEEKHGSNAAANLRPLQLRTLRLQMKHCLLDVNACLYQLTSFVAARPHQSKCADDENEEDEDQQTPTLTDLLWLYKRFRIHHKILCTQLYRITSPWLYCTRFCKNIRSVWLHGVFVNFMNRKRAISDQFYRIDDYIRSPFSAHQLHVNFSVVVNLVRGCKDDNMRNVSRFGALNQWLCSLNDQLHSANFALFSELKLCRNQKRFSRFSNAKTLDEKRKNVSKMKENITKSETQQPQEETLSVLYNHLHRLQHRMDEATAHIYLLHEQCVSRPNQVLVAANANDGVDDDDGKDDREADVRDEIAQHQSLQIMSEIMLSMHRAFNEWKFIVAQISPHSKLLQKYEHFMASSQGGYSHVARARHEPMMEHVIEEHAIDAADHTQQENGNSAYVEQHRNMMSGLFAKINRERARMSITDDGEELYEPVAPSAIPSSSETIQQPRQQQQRNIDGLLEASMAGKRGHGVSVMDKLNMVDELKKVLQNRKQAARETYQRQNGIVSRVENESNSESEQKSTFVEEDTKENENVEQTMDDGDAMENIRVSYPSEEVFEDDYGGGSDDNDDEQHPSVSQQQQVRFLQELNRLGLSQHALVTTRNTEIRSFGYNVQRDANTMSLFAVLQNQNHDVSKDSGHQEVEEEEPVEESDDDDDNGNSLADELQGCM